MLGLYPGHTVQVEGDPPTACRDLRAAPSVPGHSAFRGGSSLMLYANSRRKKFHGAAMYKRGAWKGRGGFRGPQDKCLNQASVAVAIFSGVQTGASRQ